MQAKTPLTMKKNIILVFLRNTFMLQICIFFCTITTIVQSQDLPLLDSIRYAMKSRPILTGGFDNKNTFVSGSGAPINGLEIGVSFGSKISYMVGYYFLKKPIEGIATLNRGTMHEITYATKVQFSYFSFIAEYTLYKKGRWSVYMPLQLGIGKASKRYFEKNIEAFQKQNNILPIELSVTGNYRIWKFVGVSGGLGCRTALGANIIKDEDFSGLTYSLGVKIWFGDLCQILLPKCQFCDYL